MVPLGIQATAPQGSAGAPQDENAELAKKLNNPVANLISLPLQYNYDENIGPNDDGSKSVLNVQPVWPFSINDEWNVISRTIVPLIDTDDIPASGDSENGMGDITQSLFFSPKAPTASGLIWGAGPAFLIPTASHDDLGTGKFGIGPTVVGLKQENGWTYGFLGNHIWSVAGEGSRPEVNSTFMQPFLNFTTKTYTTIGLNTESTYDWRTDDWSVPMNLTIGQLLKLGGQPVSFTIGARYWADSPENGPEDWGLRFVLTFLFPKK